MRRIAWLIVFCAACGRSDIAARDLDVSIDVTETDVAYGGGFDLTVTRTWRRDLVPSVWSDAALAPLALRLLDASTREDDERIEETRRYRAFAFAAGDVVIAPLLMRAQPRGGGPIIEAETAETRLRVRAALDPDQPGDVERPPGPWRPRHAWRWVLGVLAALAAVVWVARRRRRDESSPAPAVPVLDEPTATERALAALASLRAEDPRDDAARQTFYQALAQVTRALAGTVDRRIVPELTSEEVRAIWRQGERDSLGRVLRDCDLVKFAEFAPSEQARTQTLDAAESFVRGASA